MKKVKTLFVQLENHLTPEEVHRFRAAVIEATAREHDLFHNHKDDDTFHYRYPLIQYKSVQQQATIICLGEATNVIHYFLGQPSITLRIGQRSEELSVDRVDMRQVLVQTWTTDINYRISNWQALSQKNYVEWKQLEHESLAEQIAFLERILTGNILSACTGMGFQVNERLKVKIKKFKAGQRLHFKGQQVITFNLDFAVNISLPDYIGLGKGASVGFGVLQLVRKPVRRNDKTTLEIANEE
jgi:hypothetical protein